MDYDKFKKEYEEFEEWQQMKDDWEVPNINDYKEKKEFWTDRKSTFIPAINNDGEVLLPSKYDQKDMVNSPAHYTRGSQECIDTIEEAIQDAPDVKSGMLQSQILKYLLRLWLKENATQDAKKSLWYLKRLIKHLEEKE